MKIIPIFSIIIPLYNKREEVLRALKSVFAQSFNDYEVIVVNDGSTDGGENVVQSIEDERVHLVNQSNLGQGAARNQGVKISRGRFVAFLDADDTWAKNHLEVLNALIKKYPGKASYATAFSYLKGATLVVPVEFNLLEKPPWDGVLGNYLDVLIHETSPVHTNSICINRTIFDELGGFNKLLPLAQDVDLWVRLFLFHEIVYCSEATTFYHLDTSNQVTKQGQRYLRYWVYVKNFSEYIKDKGISENDRSLLRMLQSNFGKTVLFEALYDGNYEVAVANMGSNLVQLSVFEKLYIRVILISVPRQYIHSVYWKYRSFRLKLGKYRANFKTPENNSI